MTEAWNLILAAKEKWKTPEVHMPDSGFVGGERNSLWHPEPGAQILLLLTQASGRHERKKMVL